MISKDKVKTIKAHCGNVIPTNWMSRNCENQRTQSHEKWIEWSIVSCFHTIFTCYFSYITAATAPIHAVLEFFWPILSTIVFQSHWLLSHRTKLSNNEQQWERNDSCHNDYYHQSSKRTLPEPEVQTTNLLFSSVLNYRLSYGSLAEKRIMCGTKQNLNLFQNQSRQTISLCLKWFKISDRVENIAGKVKNAGYQYFFFPFPTVFSNPYFFKVVKSLDCVVKGYTIIHDEMKDKNF